MTKLSFSTPCYSNNSFANGVERYLAFGKKEASISPDRKIALLTPKLMKEPRWQQVARIASWATVIIPLIALAIKCILRCGWKAEVVQGTDRLSNRIEAGPESLAEIERLMPLILAHEAGVEKRDGISYKADFLTHQGIRAIIFTLDSSPDQEFQLFLNPGDGSNNSFYQSRILEHGLRMHAVSHRHGLEDISIRKTALQAVVHDGKEYSLFVTEQVAHSTLTFTENCFRIGDSLVGAIRSITKLTILSQTYNSGIYRFRAGNFLLNPWAFPEVGDVKNAVVEFAAALPRPLALAVLDEASKEKINVTEAELTDERESRHYPQLSWLAEKGVFEGHEHLDEIDVATLGLPDETINFEEHRHSKTITCQETAQEILKRLKDCINRAKKDVSLLVQRTGYIFQNGADYRFKNSFDRGMEKWGEQILMVMRDQGHIHSFAKEDRDYGGFCYTIVA
ncbi:MAG: hypothetical protein JSS32_07820 [Verrucomicrobia bacterium]|nr:hypothetical protein [Verrucomicrobiota bacterium]